jgi:hypothetical protein
MTLDLGAPNWLAVIVGAAIYFILGSDEAQIVGRSGVAARY